jgi:hypothetical protein
MSLGAPVEPGMGRRAGCAAEWVASETPATDFSRQLAEFLWFERGRTLAGNTLSRWRAAKISRRVHRLMWCHANSLKKTPILPEGQPESSPGREPGVNRIKRAKPRQGRQNICARKSRDTTLKSLLFSLSHPARVVDPWLQRRRAKGCGKLNRRCSIFGAGADVL